MNSNQIIRGTIGVCAALVLVMGINGAELKADQPQTGEKIADFELKDLNGKAHKLSKLNESDQVVLLVLRGYPGYQCPLCSKQMSSFLSKASAFDEASAKVVMIYPGAADSIEQFASEFIKGQEFPENFVFLIDPDYQFLVANDLRWDAEKETSYPSTFVIGKDGVVKYAKISKTHGGRTSPTEILAELK
ncbi:Thiol-disulfide oxidoreductase ResA [Polystyrenella longa]|uniref:thioredoxin-dependent peroxiredoxin n=1 Tax=Polystyrenella longa TaxID=2528007 RepID=A0A518CPM0_9PLAN|nr:peroxiredoxin family protein [Polystyrenella longa]QDU81163.1 Thiol-disulfide oxidoreductase ResA [Polystyrenella longa]